MDRKLANIEDIQIAFKFQAEKFIADDYINVSELLPTGINKETARKDLVDSRYHVLFEEYDFDRKDENSKERELQAFNFWTEKIGYSTAVNWAMTKIEAIYIIAWVLRIFTNKFVNTDYSMAIWIEILKNSNYFETINAKDFQKDGNIIFNAQRVDIVHVKSLSAYSTRILKLRDTYNSDEMLFYRGHSKVNYMMIPSVMRRDKNSFKYNLLERENDIYSEIQYRCPNEFKNCRSHLDKLTIMQHYGVPTRLLDITTNPLVALYFACLDSNNMGEVIVLHESKKNVKWPESDTASVLSSLAALPLDVKNEIENLAQRTLRNVKVDDKNQTTGISFSANQNECVRKLLAEIRTEKVGFADCIKARDIGRKVFVHANLNNQRIINQRGMFILFGHSYADGGELPKHERRYVDPANEYRLKTRDGKVVVILIENKQKIINELGAMGIDEAFLFPEIEDVARAMMKH